MISGFSFSNNAQKLLQQGHEYFAKKLFDKALYYFLKSAELEPENIDLHIKIGLAYHSLKKYKSSIEYFEKAIVMQNKKGHPVPHWWFLNTGYGYHYLKQYDKAVIYFLKVYNGDYDLSIKNDALFPIAHLYFLMNVYESFFKYALLCLKIEQDSHRINLTNNFLANAYYKINKINLALKYAKKCGKDFWIYKIYSPKKITFTCRFNLTRLKNRTPGKYYIPLPIETNYQKLISVESHPNYIKIIRTQGETYALYDFSNGFPENFYLKFVVNRKIVTQEPVGIKKYNSFDTEAGFFANPRIYEHNSVLYDYNDSIVKNTFTELNKVNRPIIKQIEAFAGYMRERIPHLLTKFDASTAYGKKMVEYYSNNIKKVSDVLKFQTGHCVHRPNSFTALIRLLNIPARATLGFSCNIASAFSGDEFDGHGLAEIYDDGTRTWKQVSLTSDRIWWNSWEHVVWYLETRTKPENYIPLFIGYYIKMLDGKVKWNAEFIDSF